MVSFTFDDGGRTNYTAAAPLLESRGIRGTFYITSSYLDGGVSVSRQNVIDLDRRGHEIGAHTIDHQHLPTLSTEEVDRQLTVPKAELEALIGGPVTSFASPHGDYDARVLERIRLVYRSHRSVDHELNRRGTLDPYQLRVRNVLSTSTTAEVDGWMAAAAAEGAWLILVYHNVRDNPSLFDTTAAALDSHILAAQARGLRSVTVTEGLAAYGVS